jgi:hypothetical protein
MPRRLKPPGGRRSGQRSSASISGTIASAARALATGGTGLPRKEPSAAARGRSGRDSCRTTPATRAHELLATALGGQGPRQRRRPRACWSPKLASAVGCQRAEGIQRSTLAGPGITGSTVVRGCSDRRVRGRLVEAFDRHHLRARSVAAHDRPREARAPSTPASSRHTASLARPSRGGAITRTMSTPSRSPTSSSDRPRGWTRTAPRPQRARRAVRILCEGGDGGDERREIAVRVR